MKDCLFADGVDLNQSNYRSRKGAFCRCFRKNVNRVSFLALFEDRHQNP